MSLKEQITERLKQAMLNKDELELGLFRLIKSAIKNTEIAKGHELNDDEVLAVLEKEAKQRKDSISQFDAAGRADLSEKEKSELAIIESFLPQKMSEEEVKKVVESKLTELEGQDFGRIMGAVMTELKGKADGALVQKVVKELTGK